MLTVSYHPSSGETGRFAALELARGISRMAPQGPVPAVDCSGKGKLRLLLGLPLSRGKDAFWDDGYEIDLKNGTGTLRASNPRSLLLGVYRLLTECGCAFLKPGKEFFPEKAWDTVTLRLKEEAFYRHRGICIEGADSLENILDLMDWAPKAGYNTYFTQFMEGYTFFDRWYHHLRNPQCPPEELTVETARGYMGKISQAVRLRGTLYHGVGHGWTCEPLGIPGLGWEPVSVALTEEQTRHLAQINGTRRLWDQIPLNTNLCYGSPETRELVTGAIADYAAAHPEVDVLHFWLADDYNNQCECEACQNLLPSDAYVKMLNLLDQKMTARGLGAKVAFLLYFDLLWPPVEEKIENPDRFLLMFAPITRTFLEPLSPCEEAVPLPLYRRNALQFSQDIQENLGFLSAWQKCFQGDSFDYDYHLISPLMYDMGHMLLSRILHEDIGALNKLGLDGLVHCQVQRIGLPHNFPCWMAGRALWDPSSGFESEKRLYFRMEFGDYGEEAAQFFQRAGEVFPVEYLSRDSHEAWEGYARCSLVIKAFLRAHHFLASRSLGEENRWGLRFYWRLLKYLNDYLEAVSGGAEKTSEKKYRHLADYLWSMEPETQPWFDTYLFLEYYRRRNRILSKTSF